ncbi:hypothetical protein PsorP6_003415 [Peronosclerospora sorghi]|uniref:Uncharacterized protein n=1 Tax=Peronosclerospora sorghi TaxID=230839 RepID=A0ACC0VLF5_9STRA|nr:hypothetical protein PsorP6_003415 [Peronosclerospora sorghi]
MFLASFRLPGEAQQIDRIFNAFSLQVYKQCRERFIMASVVVAYLLWFSLIMLNTDLHNPNIRSEKKMKLEDCIKNNKNYGPEVSKGLDLPEEFLTELYNTIAKDEIKTFEDGGKYGEVTSDRCILLNQAESDPRHSRLIVHHHPSVPIVLQSSGTLRNSDVAQCPALPLEALKTMKLAKNARTSLPASQKNSGRQSEHVHRCASLDHLYDCHIYELIQQNLVLAFSSVFHQFVVDSKAKDAARTEDFSISSSYELHHYVPQKSALQLACNGFVLCAAVASQLSLVEQYNAVFICLCKYTALFASEIYPLGYNGRVNGSSVYCDNLSAPVATAAVLKLVHTCNLSLRSRAWRHFFHVLNGLREFRVLPSQILHPGDEMALELMTPVERTGINEHAASSEPY